MKALDWVETFEKTNPRFWLVWLPDHISKLYHSHICHMHVSSCTYSTVAVYAQLETKKMHT